MGESACTDQFCSRAFSSETTPISPVFGPGLRFPRMCGDDCTRPSDGNRHRLNEGPCTKGLPRQHQNSWVRTVASRAVVRFRLRRRLPDGRVMTPGLSLFAARNAMPASLEAAEHAMVTDSRTERSSIRKHVRPATSQSLGPGSRRNLKRAEVTYHMNLHTYM